VDRSRELGEQLRSQLREALADVPTVADVRGLGMMIGIELVRDVETLEPFARSARVAERVLEAAREAGLLLYSSVGHVDGLNGDLVMLGPPFCLKDEDATMLVERTAAAIRAVS
jgi:adenosylmethionine-8-amino-7-oxononanoate aminotransferase